MKSPSLIVVCASTIVAACGGSGDDSASRHMSLTAPAPASSSAPSTNFTTLVKEQLSASSETTAPFDIDTVQLAFTDDSNEAAFDSVLTP